MSASKELSPAEKYGLQKIAPGIWFVQGNESARPVDSTDPSLILIFGWMDGKLAHVAKFSAGYRVMFPYSNQIVVQSRADLFILPKFVLRNRLRPILPLLRNLGVVGSAPTKHRILVHALSNGGACQLNYLSQILKKEATNVITSAMVLDSTPGGDDIRSAIYVFNHTIANPILRWVFLFAIGIVQAVAVLLRLVPVRMHDIIRKAICSPNWLPWTNKTTPFLYVYSKTDRSVPYKQVQAHTEKAETMGQDVTRLVFDDSPHVAHMRSDPERYWTAVQALWNKALLVSVH
ncbi:SubName: Full=Uncharacterized protein {ECO:0000313/EMBL:CCA74862.1} [Serendipita indica DSM 11827]|uniref:Uncharacterized protein n=1 Tax=Serendipita indica (strain DSM 11827) TaxID=1109443 RepID=G4TU69_SERID|nr:SubName: Full=Uncharacterized protein {ECO:0000313/EMBL:CCA74862.1} [Serendipita indica DSM 11827]CCA74862.1 hypothetical protein PIIN_08832 [Serendipita indica DSM 11827]